METSSHTYCGFADRQVVFQLFLVTCTGIFEDGVRLGKKLVFFFFFPLKSRPHRSGCSFYKNPLASRDLIKLDQGYLSPTSSLADFSPAS